MSEKKSSIGLLGFVFKLGPKLLTLLTKLVKFLKVGKVALAAATFAGYATIFSWKFALIIMCSLAFHESGHVWAMKRMGIKTKGFYFIPFLGGAAIAEEKYRTQGEHAFIAIMGPVWGAFLALVLYGVYLFTGNAYCAVIAGWMALLNLFNMLPVNPLDGGQILYTIATSIHKKGSIVVLFLSLALSVYLFITLHLGLMVLLFIIGMVELFGIVKGKKKKSGFYQADEDEVPTLTKGQLTLTAVSSVLLVTLLLAISFATNHVAGADVAHSILQ